MTSDEERRKIAASLRESREFISCLPNHGYMNWRGIPDEPAGLIDRPTCFDTESKDGKSLTCSACGFSEDKPVVSPFTLSFSSVKPSYRYCPKCGAAVTERGGCDVREL